MATRTLTFKIDADTREAVEGMDRVERDIGGLSRAVDRANDRMRRSWESVSHAVTGINSAMEIGTRIIGVMSSAYGALGEQTDTLNQSMSRFGQGVVQIIGHALESAGVIEDLASGVDGLTDQMQDAESGIGSFIRGGFEAIVTSGSFVIQTIQRVAQVIGFMVDSFRVGFAALLEAYSEVSSALAGGDVNNVLEDIQELDEQIYALNIRMESGEVTGQRLESMRAIRDELQSQVDVLDEEANMLYRIQQAQSALADQAAENTSQEIENMFQSAQGWETAIDTVGNYRDAIVGALSDNVEFSFATDEAANSINRMADAIDRVSLGLSSTDKLNDWIKAIRMRGPVDLGMLGEANPTTYGLGGGISSLAGAAREELGARATERMAAKSREAENMAAKNLEAVNLAAEDMLLSPFDNLQTNVESALTATFSSIGSFISGTTGAFETLGNAIKNMFAQTFSSIGQAFIQGAVSSAVSGSGPLAALFGLGALFSLVGGLLSGGGGGGAGAMNSAATSVTSDVLQSMQPEISGAGGSAIHYHIHEGIRFTNKDESARGLAELTRYTRAMGEL